MADMLSQAEIDALLGGGSQPDDNADSAAAAPQEEQPAATEEPIDPNATMTPEQIASMFAADEGASAPPSPEVPSDPDAMMTPEQIAALIDGSGDTASPEGGPEPSSKPPRQMLTDEQKDVIGEIGNISMGTAATTLFTLLNQKVWITTPKVMELEWEELKNMYDRPCVGIRVGYKEGLIGSNVLILKERDVKIITNLMMGGDGTDPSIDEPLNDIDLSAIGEAMNQMVGSSSTSLSSLTKMKIDINTPHAFTIDFDDATFLEQLGAEDFKEEVVAITFRMEIGDLIDSQIMQLLPTSFAIGMVEALKSDMAYQTPKETPSSPPPAPPPPPPPPPAPLPMPQESAMPQVQMPVPPMPDTSGQMAPGYPQQPAYDQSAYGGQAQMPQMQMPQMQMPQMQMPQMQMPQMQMPQNVSVQPVQFQNFDYSSLVQQKENIGIIMDVPLEVTVELGRTTRLIKEILEFGPGTIVELNKLAGEPVDVYVNGRQVAKGEVVVIDENFGIRITDIVSVENRV